MVIKYFIGGFVINTTLQDRLDIKIFSFRIEIRKCFVFPRGYVMFSARCMNASTSPRFCYVYFSCILL